MVGAATAKPVAAKNRLREIPLKEEKLFII